jgi:hypothetical protein
MTLRPIEPVNIADLAPAVPTTGQPIFEYVDPRSLYVDATYQRDVSERGLRQIRKMVEAWDWRRFSPPTVVYGEDADGKTVLIVIDGQHRSIAAASHPGIDAIPVMIVEAKETAEQAKAFVGTNVDRLAVTNLALLRAALAAGDEEALAIQRVVDKADVRLMASANVKYETGDCTAIVAVSGLVKRHGEQKAVEILHILAEANLIPIATPHVKAVEMLMTKDEYCDAFEPVDLIAAMLSTLSIGGDAKLFAAEHKVPLWRAMAALWFRKVKKRRVPRAADGPEPARAKNAHTAPTPIAPHPTADKLSAASQCARPRTITPHQIPTQKNVTAAVMGDPDPSRSALADWKARQAS